MNNDFNEFLYDNIYLVSSYSFIISNLISVLEFIDDI